MQGKHIVVVEDDEGQLNAYGPFENETEASKFEQTCREENTYVMEVMPKESKEKDDAE